MRTFTHGHTASPLNKKQALTNSNFVQIDFYLLLNLMYQTFMSHDVVWRERQRGVDKKTEF